VRGSIEKPTQQKLARDAAGYEERCRWRAHDLHPERIPRQRQGIKLLPAPKGPFAVYMRLYWPAEAALDGSWTEPDMLKVK
jgi:hypothetical protein